MIFNDDDETKDFIKYFYYVMPIVQTYVVKLTLKILKDLDFINKTEFIINDSIITNRYIMLLNKEENKKIKKYLNKTLLICPRCFKKIKTFKGNEEILKRWYLFCPHCNKKIYLDRFVFYNYHKENGKYIKGRYKRN